MKITPPFLKQPNLQGANRIFSSAIGAALLLAAAANRAHAQRPLGIDVSSYQGSGINWSSVKNSGRTFAWAKATEGTTITDADFAGNENNGKAAGVYMGAYHFAHPDLDSPSSEMSHFWSVAGGYIKADGKTYMPMLDMEVFNGHVGASSYSAWANAFINSAVSNAHGAGVNITPFIYVSSCNACEFDGSIAAWGADLANYNGEDPQSGNPWNTCTACEVWGAGSWDVWQYTSSASVSGVSGGVDADVFNGTLSVMTATMVASSTTTAASPNPAVAINSDGRMEVFGIGSSSDGIHGWQTTPNGGWSGWFGLGGGGLTKITAARNLDGTLESFCVAGNVPYHTYNTTNGWIPWTSMGGGVVDLAVATNTDGRIELFAAGTDGALYHNYQKIPNGATGWSGWLKIGGSGMTKVAVGIDANGTLEPFAISGTTLYHSWNGANGWVAPASLGGAITDLATIKWTTDGHLEVVGVGTGGDIRHIYQLAPNGTTGWSAWFSLGGTGMSRVATAINADGSPEIFTIGSGGAPCHDYWTGSAWSGLFGMGGTITSLATGINQDGRLEIFGRGTNGALYHNWQKVANGGTGWSGWYSLGGAWK